MGEMAYTAELAFPDEIGFAATAGNVMFFLHNHQSGLFCIEYRIRLKTYVARKTDPIGMLLAARAAEDLEGVVVWLLFCVLGLEV